MADIVICGLDDHELTTQLRSQPWHRAAVRYALQNNNGVSSPILALDPASNPPYSPRWSLLPLAPFLLEGTSGQVYLVDLGIPAKLFRDLHIKYRLPFDHRFLIPLKAV